MSEYSIKIWEHIFLVGRMCRERLLVKQFRVMHLVRIPLQYQNVSIRTLLGAFKRHMTSGTLKTSEIFFGGVTDGKYSTVGELKTQRISKIALWHSTLKYTFLIKLEEQHRHLLGWTLHLYFPLKY